MPRLPAPIHRLALRLAQPVRLRWWRIAKVRTRGCRVVVLNPEGEILLIRHTYHLPQSWMLPGGGIGRGEDAIAAAVREVREETGCRLADPVVAGCTVGGKGGWTNEAHLVAGTTADTPFADQREIAEARFFAFDSLPATLTAASHQRIALWRDGAG